DVFLDRVVPRDVEVAEPYREIAGPRLPAVTSKDRAHRAERLVAEEEIGVEPRRLEEEVEVGDVLGLRGRADRAAPDPRARIEHRRLALLPIGVSMERPDPDRAPSI